MQFSIGTGRELLGLRQDRREKGCGLRDLRPSPMNHGLFNLKNSSQAYWQSPKCKRLIKFCPDTSHSKIENCLFSHSLTTSTLNTMVGLAAVASPHTSDLHFLFLFGLELGSDSDQSSPPSSPPRRGHAPTSQARQTARIPRKRAVRREGGAKVTTIHEDRRKKNELLKSRNSSEHEDRNHPSVKVCLIRITSP